MGDKTIVQLACRRRKNASEKHRKKFIKTYNEVSQPDMKKRCALIASLNDRLVL